MLTDLYRSGYILKEIEFSALGNTILLSTKVLSWRLSRNQRTP